MATSGKEEKRGLSIRTKKKRFSKYIKEQKKGRANHLSRGNIWAKGKKKKGGRES